MKTIYYFLLFSLFSCSLTKEKDLVKLPFYNTQDLTPVWIDETNPAYKNIHAIPEFQFVNQEGEIVTQSTFEDKIYVTNFFFTSCPGICLEMTNNLSTVQKQLMEDDEVLLLSHSVTPWRDSVQQLKKYAEREGIKSGKWHLVTGKKETIYQIARESYFADEGFGKELTRKIDFLHTENVFLIDKKKRIRGVYNGTLALEMKRMLEDIETLKQEQEDRFFAFQ